MLNPETMLSEPLGDSFPEGSFIVYQEEVL
jgi:hypothetical protein